MGAQRCLNPDLKTPKAKEFGVFQYFIYIVLKIPPKSEAPVNTSYSSFFPWQEGSPLTIPKVEDNASLPSPQHFIQHIRS
jgi:hypothetical protein